MVDKVEVSPPTLSLTAGDSQTLTARVLDQDGAPLLSKQVTWSASDTNVATVTGAGVVTARAEGTALVTASADGKSGSASVVVMPVNMNPVDSVELDPTSAALVVGESVQLTATAKDAAGAVITGHAVDWTTADAAVATVNASGLVLAVGAGSTRVTGTIDGKSAAATLDVTEPQVEPGDVDVDVTTRYQTMDGWEATAQMGQWECGRTAFDNYRDALVDRAVNELGINRLRVELTSGSENTTDWFGMFDSGQVPISTWESHWYDPVNDNADPNVINPAGFQWGQLDSIIDRVANPFRNALMQRGEQLYVNLCFVDFDVTAFSHKDHPDEYAELILAAFQHLESKYGWVPDGLEIMLEPDNNSGWTTTDVGRAFIAAADRLEAAGYHPSYTLPSNTNMWSAIGAYDTIKGMSGAAGRITELSYHRYQGTGLDAAMAVGDRVRNDGVKSAMLEHIASGIDDLMEDLTVAQTSAWQQFTIGFCEAGFPGAQYYDIDISNPNNPTITPDELSRYFSQVFLHVRRGAIRYGTTVRDGSLAPLAFQNADGKWTVVVRTQGQKSFTIGRLPPGTYGVYYTTGGERATPRPDLTITAGKTADVSIPGAGLITVFQR